MWRERQKSARRRGGQGARPERFGMPDLRPSACGQGMTKAGRGPPADAYFIQPVRNVTDQQRSAAASRIRRTSPGTFRNGTAAAVNWSTVPVI
jgi:hypothetical protein